ncbi:MAG TPA: FAD-binding oxidoreductase [Euryarchaeota archaeon]|nr:FAD-binding oxidoreductase [Euryarchaeota archaeon]
MIEKAIMGQALAALSDELGEENVLWRKSDLVPYTRDTFTISPEEDNKYFPDMVVLPRTTAGVQEVVRVARKHRIPLLPKGGGSNRTGMLVPIHGGIVVDTIKMNRVLEIDPLNLSVTVQPGITLKELEEKLSGRGLALNQEQGSVKVATVGGAISSFGFSRKNQKYGTIADRVESLEVVLANGEILRTGPKVLYTSTGYKLSQLFVGAEGTLGIITEATLRVEPLPEAKETVLAFYDDFWAALRAAERLRGSCAAFVGAEAYEVENAEELGAPEGKKGIFFVMFEGLKGEVEAQAEFVRDIVRETGGALASGYDPEGLIGLYATQWCGLRAISRFEDEVLPYIPAQHIREYYDRLWNEIMPKHGLSPFSYDKLSMDVGRYSMLYGRFSIPESETGWQEYRRAHREAARTAVELGGSICACTGVGISHRDNLDLEFSDVALDVMRRIKRVLDPDNIMNPGKKLPPG